MSTTQPDSFVISLPEGWREVPIDPDGLVDAVREGAAATLPAEVVESGSAVEAAESTTSESES